MKDIAAMMIAILKMNVGKSAPMEKRVKTKTGSTIKNDAVIRDEKLTMCLAPQFLQSIG